MSSKHAQQPQNNDRASQDAKANGKASNTNTYGIVAVDVESLRRPEHDNGEEVGARNKGDDERENKCAWRLLDACWEHGVFGKLCFPEYKASQQDDAEDERDESMS